MPSCKGLIVIVWSGDAWLREFIDSSKPSRTDTSVSRVIQGSPRGAFSINIQLLPDYPVDFVTFGFLLAVNRRPVKFTQIRVQDLQDPGTMRCMELLDLTYNQTAAEAVDLTFSDDDEKTGGIIELFVLRMGEPGNTMGVRAKNRAIFYPGQIVKDFNSEQPLGIGRHFIIGNDCKSMRRATFLDDLGSPWIKFTWKYTSPDVLEASLLKPRNPAKPDYQILSHPSRFPLRGLGAPVSAENLINGLDLKSLDNLAFRHLDIIKVSDLDHLELQGKACRFLRVLNLDGYTNKQIKKYARKKLIQELREHIHKKTLTAIYYLDMEAGCDYLPAAIKSADINLSLNTVEQYFAKLKSPQIIAANLDLDELQIKCEEHMPNWDFSTSTYAELKNWAFHRLRDVIYYKAQVQVVRILAEKRMLQLKVRTEGGEQQIEGVGGAEELVGDDGNIEEEGEEEEEKEDDRMIPGTSGKRVGAAFAFGWLPERKKSRRE